jgi:hypothetical protein
MTRHGLRFRPGTSGGRGGKFAPARLRPVIESSGKAPAGFFAGAARGGRKPKEKPVPRKLSMIEKVMRALGSNKWHGRKVKQKGIHGRYPGGFPRIWFAAPGYYVKRARKIKMRRRRRSR